MTLTAASIQNFLEVIVTLRSFPLFCLHLAIVMLYPIWEKRTTSSAIKLLMSLHNFGCSLVSLYTLFGFLNCFSAIESTFKLGPEQCLLPYFKMYWISKMLELFDTVIMILRHRRKQINFLHVYHHSTMMLLADAGYHLFPWPPISVYFATNALVHFITYLIYGLSTFFPDEMLPWRKLNTKMELLEHLVLFVHVTYGYFNKGFCVYSALYVITLLSLNIYKLFFASSKPLKTESVWFS